MYYSDNYSDDIKNPTPTYFDYNVAMYRMQAFNAVHKEGVTFETAIERAKRLADFVLLGE